MVSERHRRQYLDAMGISVWVARRPIPHALDAPLPPVEEAPDEAPRDRGQRLHALLEDIERAPATPASEAPFPAEDDSRHSGAAPDADALLTPDTLPAPDDTPRPPDDDVVKRSARALLDPAPDTPEADASPRVAPADALTSRGVSSGEPLRFTIQVAALEGRWLLLLAREMRPADHEQTLLEAALSSVDIHSSKALAFERFGWPMMEGLPAVDALDEARQGFRAFLAGRHARGWYPERILLFGRLPVLEEVLDVDQGESRLLSLPFWQGPALEALADARGRRELWRLMAPWRQWWHWLEARAESEASDAADKSDAAGQPDARGTGDGADEN